ncbi:MAG: hypothetical protein ACTSSH_11480, partial [Candidatus Heimdallarchaeota archaeon]
KSNFASKRFATLDFARGLAILIMIVLHVISDTLNIDALLDNRSNLSMINLVMIALLQFLGGLAGFFLLVSSVSNMVSMMKHLQSGKSVRGLVFKQIMGGVTLVVFAMICEGVTGYHGMVGQIFRNIGNFSNIDWSIPLYRWNHFETIHTIGWCTIINGSVQGLLALKGNWKNTKKMVISYIVLAVSIVGLTQLVWFLVDVVVPGYPIGVFDDTGHKLYMPWIGSESFGEILRAIFLNPLAAREEPIFPYLAVSYIGSIIGIVISQPKEKISKKFPRRMFLAGFSMFIVGLIGVVIVIASIINEHGLIPGVEFYQTITFHRNWSPDYDAISPLFAWLWQFLLLNGFAVMLLMFVFRLVEYRGKETVFSNKTKFVRRFGTVAFSNYNNQMIYLYVYYLISILFTLTAYSKLLWLGSISVVLISIIFYHLILRLWEKINFYNAHWINLKHDRNPLEQKNDDSKLAFTMSLVGLCSVIFTIVSFLAFFVTLNARKTEGKNKQNTRALGISIAGMVLFVGGIIPLFILPLGLLGL